MEREVYLSTYDGIEVLSPQGELLRALPMKGAGTVCAAGERLFAAGADGRICRLERSTLAMETAFSGGPGICDLKAGGDGKRLYALLGDADCVLMCDAQGAKLVNRCGCNPQHLFICGDTLAAAGGESGCVYLFDPHTLDTLGEISMPGPVYAAAIREKSVYALCLTAQLDTWLVRQTGSRRETIALGGMPGCLCFDGAFLFAAVTGWLYVFSLEDLRLLARVKAPGRASKLCMMQGCVLLLDPLSECVWRLEQGGGWRLLRSDVRSMAVQ